METLDIAATDAVAPARRKRRGLGLAVAAPPSYNDASSRWPGWARMALLVGGSVALWGGLIALVLRALLH